MIGEDKIEDKNRNKERAINIFLMRYFRYIILALLILVLVFSYIYLIKPKYDEISGIVTDSKENNEVIREDLASYFLQLDKYNQKYDEVDQEIVNKINAMLPENSRTEELLSQIEDIVKNRALSLASLEIEKSEEKSSASKIKTSAAGDIKSGLSNKVGIIKIKMEVLGVNYEKLKNLLTALENNLRLMDVENLNFSPDQKTVSLEVNTYYYKNN